MTEAEWLASSDPEAMHHFLVNAQTQWKTRWQGWISGKRFSVSERKLRLFAVACCLRIMDLIPVEESRECVRAAERFAEGEITQSQLDEAIGRSMQACRAESWPYRFLHRDVVDAVGRVHRTLPGGRSRTFLAVRQAQAFHWLLQQPGRHDELEELTWELDSQVQQAFGRVIAEEATVQADLLRDIVGNPFRPPRLDPAWLAWDGGTVARIAGEIYRHRQFADMPVLGDALEDAGCGEPVVLEHCRHSREHTRGCWVLDLLLGKE